MCDIVDINQIIKFYQEGKIIGMFSRSKYTIKYYYGYTLMDYVQSERKVKLINNGKEYLWDPVNEDNLYLALLPLERILEIEITDLKYDSLRQELVFSFINGDSLILDNEDEEGIWLNWPSKNPLENP
jgi:hypothetical protein